MTNPAEASGPSLPIDDALPALLEALASGNRAVLAAPPGAGKTTRVPLALLAAPWREGRRILLLEPRRIAARMAAARMASVLGEKVGERVGVSTRVERKVSAKTQIEVITDGLFARRILSDPELSGVGAVLFDEFHERSLSLDLGLALAADAQAALRPDLRLLIMSATLDTAATAAMLSAPVIESDGRLHPVETRYLGRSEERLEDQMARAVRKALREEEGSILAFLPGQGEIRRTAERLDDLPEGLRTGIVVSPLYGALSPRAQDLAVAAPPAGKRKIVLATDIAESSLTIESVRIVIDAGYSRRAVADAAGVGGRLETVRASRANVDQRRGRAGRTAPGVCYRLWDEEATRGLPAAPRPEIAEGDLTGLVMALAEWGERDAARLLWLDPPSPGRLAKAKEALRELGALDENDGLTAKGRVMAGLPMPPRDGAMIAAAETPTDKVLASEIAILLGERGLGGDAIDLRDRLRSFYQDRSARAQALRAQARRWASTKNGSDNEPKSDPDHAGVVLANGRPGFIGKIDRKADQMNTQAPQSARGTVAVVRYQLANGGAAQIAATDPLAASDWLAIADVRGGGKSGATPHISAAAPLSEDDALACGVAETLETAHFDPVTGHLSARRVTRLGAIVMSSIPLPRPKGEAARNAFLLALKEHGLAILPHTEVIHTFLARLALVSTYQGTSSPLLDAETLTARAEEWLGPLLADPPSFANISAGAMRHGVNALLPWDDAREVDRLAPASIKIPSGRDAPIDYLAEGGPIIEGRVQEFFGAAAHPTILAGGHPLTVSLLSPARRPVATTKDLPGFWQGGYRDMVKDMRGRYPKHDWPDDPAAARAHEGRTKARL